jgi:hypothetical protein
LTRNSVGGGVFGASLLVWSLFTLFTTRLDITDYGFWTAGILFVVGFIFVIVGFTPKKEKGPKNRQASRGRG